MECNWDLNGQVVSEKMQRWWVDDIEPLLSHLVFEFASISTCDIKQPQG
jgi:hypothetical protein